MIISISGSPIGRNIRYLRRMHRMSREDLAKQLNICVESVIFLEEEIECIFTDHELHSLCDLFMISEKMLIEMDLELFDNEKNPAP